MSAVINKLLCISCTVLLTLTMSAQHGEELRYEPVSETRLLTHMSYLASDELQGRAPGTAGGNLAAAYIVDQLHQFGLQPLDRDASFFQGVPLHASTPLATSRCTIYSDDSEIELTLGQDYLLYNQGAQTAIPQPAELIFVGYGIVAPEYNHDDYRNVNVQDKIVVFLPGEPPSRRQDYFAGYRSTFYSDVKLKQRLALAYGAIGSICLSEPGAGADADWDHLRGDFSFEDISLASCVTGNLSLLLHHNMADELFAGASESYNDVLRRSRENQVHSFPLKTKLSFRGEFQERDFISPNVVGLLEGSDPLLKDSYLLVSAHYDHLGIGPAVNGDSIYNGAIDNAVGVATLLEIARTLSAQEERPARSIVFAFFTAEEKGLLGARYYVDHPLVPMQQTVANLNIDGMAIFSTFEDVVGIGANLSTLGYALENTASRLGLGYSELPDFFQGADGFDRSDQFILAQAGVPSILVREGLIWDGLSEDEAFRLHLLWQQEIYHTPADDMSQLMNLEATMQHANVLQAFASSLANEKNAAEWLPSSPFQRIHNDKIADK